MTQSPQSAASSLGASEPGFDGPAMLALLREGDERACEAFVRRYGGRMLTVARRYLHTEQDAADAVQEAFLSAFRALQGFQGQAQLSTWLHSIVVNCCLMRLRSARTMPTVSIERLLPVFDQQGHHARPVRAWDRTPFERLHAVETQTRVRACIAKLPDTYRVILLLRDIEGFDTAQTATRLGITETAVKVRLHRARMALRALLEPHFQRGVDGREAVEA